MAEENPGSQRIYGPYSAQRVGRQKTIVYKGNKVHLYVDDIQQARFTYDVLRTRLNDIVIKEAYYHLHCVDNIIFAATVEYFYGIGGMWCNLPQTTTMISSPGEVYSGKILDYTTDALPIELKWFELERPVYLAESSQFYLEMRLLLEGVDKVFAIYNSFRKERADFSHLAEFHHIEFEGKVDLDATCEIVLGLLRHIVAKLVRDAGEHLDYFLSSAEKELLPGLFDREMVQTISFAEAMRLLLEDTGDRLYEDLTLKYFGAWEEIRLTEILGKHVFVREFPLYEIPFYHAARPAAASDVAEEGRVAMNADLILFGYREAVGAGARIVDPFEIRKKAEVFNLPFADYEPYIRMREYKNYVPTSGFGLGWERLVHWLLKMPTIWHAVHIPRGHIRPHP